MADFTVTTTITGSVNGQALNIEHEFVLEDVTSVIFDQGYATATSSGTTFQASSLGARGQHAENSVAFACFAPTTPYATQVALADGGTPRHISAALAPLVYHHGEDWNGSINGATSLPPADPTSEITGFRFHPLTPFEYRAIALLKPVS